MIYSGHGKRPSLSSDLNECELGFHDCDPRAECHDMEEGYHCVCPEGWQGKGVVTDSSDALANGRVCIGQEIL